MMHVYRSVEWVSCILGLSNYSVQSTVQNISALEKSNSSNLDQRYRPI